MSEKSLELHHSTFSQKASKVFCLENDLIDDDCVHIKFVVVPFFIFKYN